jgi:tetratricopeptide (TPR) repeat protein
MTRTLLLVLVLAGGGGACASTVAPPAVVTAPKFPEFTFPGLAPPVDPKQADLLKLHDAGWRWLQAGDLPQAEREFQLVLKRSPAFYPSETALGYVELARKNSGPALEHFDRVVLANPTYVPALLGKGQTLLEASRELEALGAFEAALKSDPTLTDVARRVEVLRALQAQETVAAAPIAEKDIRRLDPDIEIHHT